jgi:hypothetical protein
MCRLVFQLRSLAAPHNDELTGFSSDMRFYLVHVLIKDLSFWITFFLVTKFIIHGDLFFETGFWTGKDIIGASMCMTMGFLVIGLIIFTGIYFFSNTKKTKDEIVLVWSGTSSSNASPHWYEY